VTGAGGASIPPLERLIRAFQRLFV
jgi:hypothetical protein